MTVRGAVLACLFAPALCAQSAELGATAFRAAVRVEVHRDLSPPAQRALDSAGIEVWHVAPTELARRIRLFLQHPDRGVQPIDVESGPLVVEVDVEFPVGDAAVRAALARRFRLSEIETRWGAPLPTFEALRPVAVGDVDPTREQTLVAWGDSERARAEVRRQFFESLLRAQPACVVVDGQSARVSSQRGSVARLADAIEPAVIGAIVERMVVHGHVGVDLGDVDRIVDEAGAWTPRGDAVVRALTEVRRTATEIVGARVRYAPIWILHSRPCERLDRGLARAGTDHVRARLAWQALIRDTGHQPRSIDEADFVAALGEGGPSVLVLPELAVLDDDAIRAIIEFVRDGGIAVADHGAATRDADFRQRRSPALGSVFGLERASDHGGVHRLESGLVIAEPSIRSKIAEPIAGRACVHCEHEFGRGRAIYWNLVVRDYLDLRLDPARVDAARDLRRRVRRVIEGDAGLGRSVSVDGRGFPRCLEVVSLRSGSGGEFVAVRVEASDSPALLRTLRERGPRSIRLDFDREVRLRDLRTGEQIGVGRQFERRLDPSHAMLLQLESAKR